MTMESEARAERFRCWKEDLTAREPKGKRPMKPPSGAVGEQISKFEMWQLEHQVLDDMDAVERANYENMNAYNGRCSDCGMSMKGMTVAERAEHYLNDWYVLGLNEPKSRENET
jgi:hypothetical protein